MIYVPIGCKENKHVHELTLYVSLDLIFLYFHSKGIDLQNSLVLLELQKLQNIVIINYLWLICTSMYGDGSFLNKNPTKGAHDLT